MLKICLKTWRVDLHIYIVLVEIGGLTRDYRRYIKEDLSTNSLFNLLIMNFKHTNSLFNLLILDRVKILAILR
ncbi:hypothetical protein QVD17_33133 [Tagetes erecta]|uniref:Uncharacterized protein n=1 Tax=Tagetes erecta TaxID=13708 RepID=A0AAD8JWG5_TARER|nr:hypothetical protein QVD17_33133 [Tagetes erecta]